MATAGVLVNRLPQAREQVIKAALYEVLLDEAEVERIFLIIKAQGEY